MTSFWSLTDFSNIFASKFEGFFGGGGACSSRVRAPVKTAIIHFTNLFHNKIYYPGLPKLTKCTYFICQRNFSCCGLSGYSIDLAKMNPVLDYSVKQLCSHWSVLRSKFSRFRKANKYLVYLIMKRASLLRKTHQCERYFEHK